MINVFNKRWFQVLVAFILIFTLILLMSVTDFVFDPLLKYIGAIAIPFIGAGILYYLTSPLVALLQKIKINKIISIVIVFLILLLLGFLFVIYIFPIVQAQYENLIRSIPKMVREVENFIGQLQNKEIMIPDQVDDAIQDFMNNLQMYIENIVAYLFGFIGSLISLIASVALIPFFLFFMLKDDHKLVPFITQIFSKKKAANLKNLLKKVNDTLSGFIQGQLIVSAILGVLVFIGYIAIGLNYSLTLALFALIMNVIPFLGPFIAVTPALIVAIFQGLSTGDPLMVVWVGLITIVAQQLESNFISPNVMGRALSLHPLTVITVILAAGSIAGFIGILFAVPFYAVVKTIVVHFYETYRKSKDSEEEALI